MHVCGVVESGVLEPTERRKSLRAAIPHPDVTVC